MTSKPGAESEAPMPNLHDGSLVGMVLLSDKQCVLFIADTLGTMHNLTVSGIEGLRAENFLQGNIVLDVFIQTGAAVSEDDVLWALSIEKDHLNQHRAYIDVVLGRINRRELSLLQVYASYGCTLTSLCNRVSPNTLQHKDMIRFLGLEAGS